MPGPEPTHGDILEKLGELKGQVATLITLVAEKREDINALYGRVSTLEKDWAKWVGICLAAAFLMPLVTPRIQQGLGIIEHNAEQKLERLQ